MSDIDHIIQRIQSLPDSARAAMQAEIDKALSDKIGLPQPGQPRGPLARRPVV